MNRYFISVVVVLAAAACFLGAAAAQHTLYAVSGQGRGSPGDVKQGAQITQLQSEHSELKASIETCAAKGMVYGPSEADADGDGCLYAEGPCGDLGMLYGPDHPDADANGCLAVVDDCGNQGMLSGPEHAAADGNGCIAHLVIDENGVPAAQKGVKLGDQATCDADHEGVLRYNPAVKTVLFCDGEYWQEIGAAPETSTTFNDVTDAEPGQTYTTGQATVSGFFGERTVTASNGALILVNGSLQGASASVSDGDRVQLRLTASSNFSTSKSTTMTLGSLSTSWTVTTREQDTTPNNFDFADLTEQETGVVVASNTVTVSGFDGPLTATVSGQGSPQIRTGSGSWGTSASVSPGQSLRVRLTTSGSELTTRVATVSLGDVTTNWSVETAAAGADCSLPWGGTIGHGDQVRAWKRSSVARCKGSCQSEWRECNDGTLTGSYTNHSCSTRACTCSWGPWNTFPGCYDPSHPKYHKAGTISCDVDHMGHSEYKTDACYGDEWRTCGCN